MKLTRKPGESFELFLGSQRLATITITNITPGRCSVDIQCPDAVDVLRSELIDRETGHAPQKQHHHNH